MYIGDRLVGLGAIILKHVEGLGAGGLEQRSAKPRQHASDGRCMHLRELIERDRRLFRDHQRMAARERIEIQKRQYLLIFV